VSLESYLQAVPKAELHLHLEGAIQPATLLELARRNGYTLPASRVEELREWFIFRDFRHFVEIILTICNCLETVDDFEFIVYELGVELARQNVRYAEVTTTPGAHYPRGISQATYLDGLRRGRQRVLAELGVEINWVFDIVRGSRSLELHDKMADYTTGLAIEAKSEGVVALGGHEVGYPPEEFAGYFAKAKAAGLRSAPHAGELVGPPSVWAALNSLHADRLGHGVRAIEDPALVQHLAEQAIPLEINLTSNLCLRVYPGLAEHPLRRLYEAGVTFTVNTDDPALFNTTLNQEIGLLASQFGFELPAIEEILLNGVRHSFLPPERKSVLLAAFRAEMAQLRAIHLGSYY
jgi:adenosine deaminase